VAFLANLADRNPPHFDSVNVNPFPFQTSAFSSHGEFETVAGGLNPSDAGDEMSLKILTACLCCARMALMPTWICHRGDVGCLQYFFYSFSVLPDYCDLTSINFFCVPAGISPLLGILFEVFLRMN
jgi:hypothetical protein